MKCVQEIFEAGVTPFGRRVVHEESDRRNLRHESSGEHELRSSFATPWIIFRFVDAGFGFVNSGLISSPVDSSSGLAWRWSCFVSLGLEPPGFVSEFV